MLVSERRVTTGGGVVGVSVNVNGKHPGIPSHMLKSGRAVKIYVIDPRKFQERLEKYVGTNISTSPNEKGKRNDIPVTKVLNNDGEKKGLESNGPEGLATLLAKGVVGTEVKDKPKPETNKKRKQGVKKKLVPKKARKGSISEEKQEAAEIAFLMKETTTRIGRVSKSVVSTAATTLNSNIAPNLSQPASPTGTGSIFSMSGLPSSVPPSPSPSLVSVNSQGQRQPRIKKREPPEVFRCQTCKKVYLGHTKLNLHFQKFPSHLKTEESSASSISPKRVKHKNTVTHQSVGVGDGICTTNDFSFSSSNFSGFRQVATSLPTFGSSKVTIEIQTDPAPFDLNHNLVKQFSSYQHQPSLIEQLTSNVGMDSFIPSSKGINPDALSDNCTSPKLPDYDITLSSLSTNARSSIDPERLFSTGTSMDPVFLQAGSPLGRSGDHELQPITVPDLCAPPGPQGCTSRTGYFMDFQAEFNPQSDFQAQSEFNAETGLNGQTEFNPQLEFNSQTGYNSEIEFNSPAAFNSQSVLSVHISSELLGAGSCSQQSFNSLENLLADSSSQTASDLPRSLASPGVERSSSQSQQRGQSPGENNKLGFFGSAVAAAEAEAATKRSSSSKGKNSIKSSFTCSTRTSNIPPIDEESRDVCSRTESSPVITPNATADLDDTESSLDGCAAIALETPPQPMQAYSRNGKRKSIWEFVKEQIRLCGINQACGEISEMADKLSRVARDKFYPIREEEIERMNGTIAPIITVDTPFISHLLDLPFGTYIFKEDGGIRKIIPPPTPVSAELSLTGGVEVDIDKFLSPDIDLISLPHLTNLDFAAICNE